jgi:hypothetical protein
MTITYAIHRPVKCESYTAQRLLIDIQGLHTMSAPGVLAFISTLSTTASDLSSNIDCFASETTIGSRNLADCKPFPDRVPG